MRVVAAGACKHRNLVGGLFDGERDYTKMLFARQRGAFARGAAGHQEVDTLIDLATDQTANRGFIQRTILLKRRNQSRPASRKHLPPPEVLSPRSRLGL